MAALKGAFLNYGAGTDSLPIIIVFQFNPTQVKRSLSLAQQPIAPNNSGKVNSLEQPCQPGETVSFSLRLDANDQLADRNQIAAEFGILPTLSALELLTTPMTDVSANLNLGAGRCGSSGSHKMPPTTLPTVLFFWGRFRLLPVTINSIDVTETEYDTQLNPIRADVSITLQVLQESQLAGDRIAIDAYRYTQGMKEVMAALNLANAARFGLSSVKSFSI